MDWTGTDSGHGEQVAYGAGEAGDARRDRAESEESPPTVLVADATLSNGSLALSETLTATRDGVLVPDHHTVSAAGDRTLFLAVTDVSRPRIEEAFALDPTVVSTSHVATFPDCERYRLSLADAAVLVAPTAIELGARTQSVRGVDGAWHARLQFPGRESLLALRQFCDERDIRFGIDSLYRTDGTDEGTTTLTDRQWHALRVAFEAGYFEIPRTVTQDDLAERLGISKSAVSHRLRRATAGLVRESVDDLGGDGDA